MTLNSQPMRLYFKEHLPYFIFIFVLIGTGIVFGALMVNALTFEQKQEISRHLSGFMDMMSQTDGVSASASFQQSILLHIKWLALIWALGLSIVGLPLVFALDFLKGVLVGFSAGYMIGEYSWNGLLFAVASILPQNLLIIPAFVVASVAATVFAVHLVKSRVNGKQGALLQPFWTYTGTAMGMAVLLILAALYEGYLSPELIRWAAPVLTNLTLSI